MAQTPEGKVKAKIKAYLKSLAPSCWHFMPIGGPYATIGIPDIVGCYRGVFFAIEVKAPGKLARTTQLQKLTIGLIQGAGGAAIVADDTIVVAILMENLAMGRGAYTGIDPAHYIA